MMIRLRTLKKFGLDDLSSLKQKVSLKEEQLFFDARDDIPRKNEM